MMKKVLFSLLLLAFVLSAMAQQNLQLRSVDKAECAKSDMTSLRASFSFSTIQAEDVESERGIFSWLSMANTVIGGNEGDPQIPVVNELIAVPFGAMPRIEITSYSTTDYQLDDLGMHTLVPRQPSVCKDQRPEDVPFVYNESAYQTRGLRSAPNATVSVEGVMRGIRLGKMTIEPVSYDPVNNTLRVFNDIEVEVHFDGADVAATEQMLVDTYSPYFDIVYKQLFNGRGLRDAYSQHPDLYTTPVKMLVITTSSYVSNTTFQNWVTWKKQKGIYVDVYTTSQTGTSASSIKSFITTQYNQNHPTFLVIVGDSGNVPQSATGSETSKHTDLYYSSPDGDIFPDIYTSRMPVSSSNELTYLLDKIMQYEQYSMPDPSYLDETLLIAGWDSNWTPKVGKPTIQYANTYYFNEAHGITPHVFLTTASGQTTCYNYINQVGFVNYTAHGSQTSWSDPSFTVSQVNNLTNTNKYFWAMGNCCLAADWGYSGTCFAEAMLRAQNKGAFGYIGSCPSTYWYEDYYFGVGATTVFSQMPTMEQTQDGVYDAMFDDDAFNTLNAVPFFGNVAVTYAHAGSYQYSVTDKYYWEAYHCLGDGSVMPYHKNPSANNVSHANVLLIGSNSFTVSADAGSYVGITVNNEIIGAAEVPSNGIVNVSITPQSAPGTAMIVVTRNQRQPYTATVDIIGGTQYNITCSQPDHGSISAPAQAYAQAMVTLTATGDEGYCLSAWDVRDASNHPVEVTDNHFIMPESDVTVAATFVPGKKVTLAEVMNGSISADPICALAGTTITLSASPDENYFLSTWIVFKTDDVNSTVTVTGNQFTMPDFDVTVVAVFKLIQEENVIIGGDGTETFNYLPTYAYWKFNLSQQIYTASEIGQAGSIKAIAFKNSNSNTTTRTLDVDLAHTSKTYFSGNGDWVSMNASNKVFSGDVVFVANGWTTITLDTPFEYDGQSNLIVCVDDNTGSYISSSACPSFYVYSTSTQTAIYKYNDATDYDPASMTESGSRVKNNNQITFTINYPGSSVSLAVAPNAVTGFNCYEGAGPSEPKSIAVIGAELENDVIVTAPADFEVCATVNGTYANTLTLIQSELLTANVYVRLKDGLGQGSYTDETLAVATGSLTSNVSLNGEVYPMLAAGWNWWAPTKTMSLEDLQTALGGNAIIIDSQDGGFVRYENNTWSGTLTEITPGQMYKIETTAPVGLNLSGTPATGVSLTLMPGYNWFGYTGTQAKAIGSAFNGFTPTNGDRIVAQDGTEATYNNGWSGQLTTLVPGHGYVYISNAEQSRTLSF